MREAALYEAVDAMRCFQSLKWAASRADLSPTDQVPAPATLRTVEVAALPIELMTRIRPGKVETVLSDDLAAELCLT